MFRGRPKKLVGRNARNDDGRLERDPPARFNAMHGQFEGPIMVSRRLHPGETLQSRRSVRHIPWVIVRVRAPKQQQSPFAASTGSALHRLGKCGVALKVWMPQADFMKLTSC